MPIIEPDAIIRADNYIESSEGASDEGRVPKLNDQGSLNFSMSNIFGDGADGDVTISSPTTLTRNMYYNNLTVNSTLTTNGYQIFVKETIDGSGTIDWGTANNGSGINGGTQSGSGPLKNVAGVNGGSGPSSGQAGGAGTAGGTQTSCIGSTSVPGGAGANGGEDPGGAGGIAGTATYFRKFGYSLPEVIGVYSPDNNGLYVIARPQPASGGGGGGGGDGNYSGSVTQVANGGGSGASGGIVFIAARIWAGTFTIKSVGGNGANGTTPIATGSAQMGGAGGGGGGNGGIAIIIYGTKTWTGSYNLAGGTGGTGSTGTNGMGTGTSGSNGNTGTYYEFK